MPPSPTVPPAAPRSPAPTGSSLALLDVEQSAVHVGGAAGVALDLAARGDGQTAGLHEHHPRHLQAVLGRDRLAHGLPHAGVIDRLSTLVMAVDLGRHHNFLALTTINGEARRQPNRGMRLLGTPFDVLWIPILAIDDD